MGVFSNRILKLSFLLLVLLAFLLIFLFVFLLVFLFSHYKLPLQALYLLGREIFF